jgi:hypothetical protein
MPIFVRNYCQQGTIIGWAVLVLLLSFFGKAYLVHADHGGYVDLTFECDVTITCPTVCAVSVEACPNELQCSGDTETLCNDGSCATFCDPALPSICAETSLCAPVTCASIDIFYDSCKDYSPWYEFATTCPGLEAAAAAAPQEAMRLWWTKKSYIVVYLWVSTLAVAIVSWCWYK